MSIITKPNSFSAGGTIVASEHNDNFNTIYNEFNGNISNANISNSAAIAYSKLNLSSSIQSSDIASGLGFCPTGVVLPYVNVSAPTGWLLCDGSTVSRSTYATLFAIIGTTYGSGDGSTTFNIPDMRENVPVGYKAGSTQFGTLGGTYGEKTHTLTTPEMPSHTHDVPHVGASLGTVSGGAPQIYYDTSSVTSTSTGGGGAHNNIQPSVVFNYIIKT